METSLLPNRDDIHPIFQTQAFLTDLCWKTTLLLRAELALELWQSWQSTSTWKTIGNPLLGSQWTKSSEGWRGEPPSEATDTTHELPSLWASSVLMCTCKLPLNVQVRVSDIFAPIGNTWFCLLNLPACLELALFVWNGVKGHKFTSYKANSDSSLKHMALYFLCKRRAKAAKQTQRQDAR